MTRPALVTKHEVCECGHCRCVHVGGFQGCTKDGCARYTWPGVGADLPEFHNPGQRYKPQRKPRP